MNTIKNPSSNLGGVSKFFLVPTDQFSNLGSPDSDGLRYLTISSFNTSWEINAVYQSLEYIENQVESAAGPYYDKSFQAIIPKDSVKTHIDLQSMVGKKWLLIYLDQNGNYKYVGSPEYPLRVSFSVRPGKLITDLNQFVFRVSGKSPQASHFILSPFLPPPETPIQ